jgi:hypothetical protein
MKILPVGADIFHAGGRAGGRIDRHDKANIRSLQFWERALKLRRVPALCVYLFLMILTKQRFVMETYCVLCEARTAYAYAM